MAPHLPTGCTCSSKEVRDSSKFELRIWLAVCVPGTSNASGIIHGRFVGKENRSIEM